MGKKKAVVKDKKLQSIRTSNIKVKIKYSEKLKEYYFYMEVDRVIEPSARPRTTSRFAGMYDPLSAYKKHIENVIKDYLSKNNFNFIPYSGPCRSVIKIYKKPKKSLSMKDKFINILYRLPILVKPDIDNVEKTIWDIFNKLIIVDDNQIYSSKTVKRYSDCNKTIIKLYFENEHFSIKEYKNKRLSKENISYIKSLYDVEDE